MDNKSPIFERKSRKARITQARKACPAALGTFLAVLLSFIGGAEPQVWVPNPAHEFEEIIDGELLCWDFTLENMGTGELVLGPVATSCACTYVPLAQDRLAPGESLWVRVCFDASGGKHVEESVSIRTNDPKQPWVRLVLRGYMQPAAPYQAAAKELLSSLYLLLDVRTLEEYSQGHLLGAVNLRPAEMFAEGALPGAIKVAREDLITFASVLPRVGDLPEGGRYTVWLVDENGKAGAEAAKTLRERGIPAVGLVGGLRNWRARYGSVWLIPQFWLER